MDPNMAVINSTCWDFTMTSGGGAGYSQQAMPLQLRVSLFTMLKLFGFSFSPTCPPHICTL